MKLVVIYYMSSLVSVGHSRQCTCMRSCEGKIAMVHDLRSLTMKDNPRFNPVISIELQVPTIKLHTLHTLLHECHNITKTLISSKK